MSALTDTIAEYSKAIGRSRKTNRLWDSVSVWGSACPSEGLVNEVGECAANPWEAILTLEGVASACLPEAIFATLYGIARLGQRLYVAWRRTKERQYTPDHPEYVALTSALKGGYFSGFFESFCVFLVILSARAVVPASKLSALSLSRLQIAGIVWVSYLIFPLVLVLMQRPLVVRAQHPSPGGLLFAACDIFVPPLVYLVVTLGMFQDVGKAATVGSCALVFYLIYAAWLKPWKPGLTRTQVRHKIQETKRMTRELVGDIAQEYAGMMQERAEIMQKYAEVDDPAIKNLFLPGNRYRIPLDYEKRGALPRKR